MARSPVPVTVPGMHTPEWSERQFGHRRHAGKMLAQLLTTPVGSEKTLAPAATVAFGLGAPSVAFEVAGVVGGPVAELVEKDVRIRSFRSIPAVHHLSFPPAPPELSFRLASPSVPTFELFPASVRFAGHHLYLVTDAAPSLVRVRAAIVELRSTSPASITLVVPAWTGPCVADATRLVDEVLCLRVASPRAADRWFTTPPLSAAQDAELLARARKRFRRAWRAAEAARQP